MFLVIYLIGMVISTIIFTKVFFKYNDSKDRFGLGIGDVNEQEHYSCIAFISWFYPLVWIAIIISISYNTSVNFVKYLSEYDNSTEKFFEEQYRKLFAYQSEREIKEAYQL
jgi:hypothetical protein